MNVNTKKSKLQTFTNKHCSYVTSTTLLLFHTTSNEIDDLVPSIDECINIHEANRVKRPEPPLHCCNNSLYINVVWVWLKQMIIWRGQLYSVDAVKQYNYYLPPLICQVHRVGCEVVMLTLSTNTFHLSVKWFIVSDSAFTV